MGCAALTRIETDYLIVGAGAGGLAFADTVVTESDADVVLVDRRPDPGGHWDDAYPFVRLHQPSVYYAVASRVLGDDAIDASGPDAGLYQRATGPEVLDYFHRVLDEQLLPSGRVRFLGGTEHVGGDGRVHQLVSRANGEMTAVQVRRKVVDALPRDLRPRHAHPLVHRRPGVRLLPVNDLPGLADLGTGCTVIGGGKTATDACTWLLERGVPPERIRWIRPRDAWLLDRAFQQPVTLVSSLVEGLALSMEAAAQAEDVADLFRRLEACGQLLRTDADVEPTMYRCATATLGELEQLRSIEDVVRHGRVVHLVTERIQLEGGSVPSEARQVHVDCSATGLREAPSRPIFEPHTITLQQVRACQPTFNAALLAFVEAHRDDETEKNRLCPPSPFRCTRSTGSGGP